MRVALLFTAIFIYARSFAQDGMHMGHEHSHEMSDTMHKMSGMDMNMNAMSHAFSRNLPMTRNGSGTGWNPDAAPMYGIMKHTKSWMFMFHGDIFLRYNVQDIGNAGSRGGNIVDAPDMLMAMGQRNMGQKGLFHFNIMLSTDAIITGERGYPLLFQTGESAFGKPIVDRQHPHDLFSELSVSYAYSFSKRSDLFIYAGYPAEPALGPVTFMHRISGEFMPDAPIGHHWADATHITFGVATMGVRYGKFKLEGSAFTGREPDENRYNFDKPLFDSRSIRLSCNLGRNWALQISHGFIASPEALRPDEDVIRNTASATYAHPLTKGFVAATALWGQNLNGDHISFSNLAISDYNVSNSALLEATLKLKRLAIYTRCEWVQKSVEELNLNTLIYGDEHRIFPVNVITVGGGYDLLHINPLTVAAGAQGSVYTAPDELTSLYGAKPIALEIYLHIYPKLIGK